MKAIKERTTADNDEVNDAVGEANPSGHYGCPHCGSREFTIGRGYTEFGGCLAHAEWKEQREDDEPDFEEDHCSDHDSYETEYHDYADEHYCSDCGKEYTQAVFHAYSAEELERKKREDAVAEAREEQRREERKRKEALLAPWKKITDRFEHADDVEIEALPHATLIRIIGVEFDDGDESGEEDFTSHLCPGCGESFLHLPRHTSQVYRSAPTLPSGREKLFDSRLLPVLLQAPLCKECRPKFTVIGEAGEESAERKEEEVLA